MHHERQGMLTIGAFAAASRLSQKALRLYASLGILAPSYVDAESGYRYYREAQLREARLVLLLRQMDMPLATIRRVLAGTRPEAEALVGEHMRAQEKRLERSRHVARDLLALIREEEPIMSFEISVREAPAQPIVSITRKVKVDSLTDHIASSLATLNGLLQRQGMAPAGPPLGIYHGPVNQEDDGPMEVCLPVSQQPQTEGEAQTRDLPAGKLACVTLRGSQCDFPAILEGYDAIWDWAERNGYKLTEPPREIWLSEPGAAGSPDEAMEIAWAFGEK